LQDLHAELGKGYIAHPEHRPMGDDLEIHGRRRDGTEFPMEVGLSPRQTDDGLLITVIIRDVSQRVQTEQTLRTLSGRLIRAQEEERSRIARELHDDLNQRLALMAVELEQLGLNLPETASELAEPVRELLQQTGELSHDVHRLSYQLHPAKLDHLGLAAALKTFCEDFGKRSKIEVAFQRPELPKPLPADVALCLYRIAQESLRNVANHSGAKTARVELTKTADFIHLSVTDSGAGFDPDSADGAGLGLISMRERLRLVDGEISIVSKPGEGTRVEARVPVPGSTV
jgi:signal transduction histidine kinase